MDEETGPAFTLLKCPIQVDLRRDIGGNFSILPPEVDHSFYWEASQSQTVSDYHKGVFCF